MDIELCANILDMKQFKRNNNIPKALSNSFKQIKINKMKTILYIKKLKVKLNYIKERKDLHSNKD